MCFDCMRSTSVKIVVDGEHYSFFLRVKALKILDKIRV